MYMVGLNDEIMCRTGSGNKIYWMLTTENGAGDFELRYIELPPGGRSSYGKHSHEHEVFVVAGRGRIKGTDYEKELLSGTAVLVPGEEEHQWVNASQTEPFGFVCVVPKGAESESKPPCRQ
jgi:quercetin dioxygenase-like cupin family protein